MSGPVLIEGLPDLSTLISLQFSPLQHVLSSIVDTVNRLGGRMSATECDVTDLKNVQPQSATGVSHSDHEALLKRVDELELQLLRETMCRENLEKLVYSTTATASTLASESKNATTEDDDDASLQASKDQLGSYEARIMELESDVANLKEIMEAFKEDLSDIAQVTEDLQDASAETSAIASEAAAAAAASASVAGGSSTEHRNSEDSARDKVSNDNPVVVARFADHVDVTMKPAAERVLPLLEDLPKSELVHFVVVLHSLPGIQSTLDNQDDVDPALFAEFDASLPGEQISQDPHLKQLTSGAVFYSTPAVITDPLHRLLYVNPDRSKNFSDSFRIGVYDLRIPIDRTRVAAVIQRLETRHNAKSMPPSEKTDKKRKRSVAENQLLSVDVMEDVKAQIVFATERFRAHSANESAAGSAEGSVEPAIPRNGSRTKISEVRQISAASADDASAKGGAPLHSSPRLDAASKAAPVPATAAFVNPMTVNVKVVEERAFQTSGAFVPTDQFATQLARQNQMVAKLERAVSSVQEELEAFGGQWQKLSNRADRLESSSEVVDKEIGWLRQQVGDLLDAMAHSTDARDIQGLNHITQSLQVQIAALHSQMLKNAAAMPPAASPTTTPAEPVAASIVAPKVVYNNSTNVIVRDSMSPEERVTRMDLDLLSSRIDGLGRTKADVTAVARKCDRDYVDLSSDRLRHEVAALEKEIVVRLSDRLNEKSDRAELLDLLNTLQSQINKIKSENQGGSRVVSPQRPQFIPRLPSGDTNDGLIGRKQIRCLSCNRLMDNMRSRPKHTGVDFRKMRSHLPQKHTGPDSLTKRLAEEYHIFGSTADLAKKIQSPGRLPPLEHSAESPTHTKSIATVPRPRTSPQTTVLSPTQDDFQNL
eukprot:ANDGO_05683.mRNA.1 hypothetical protein DQ04_01461010